MRWLWCALAHRRYHVTVEIPTEDDSAWVITVCGVCQ